jgi:hypothetical protein
MNKLSQLLPVASILACGVAQPPPLAAFGIGLSMTCLSFWMGRKWPDPKPTFVPVISRPDAKTVHEERRSIAFVAGAMIVGGLICLFLLPPILPVTIWTFFWPPMGAHVIGQGVGTLILGWIAAPKDVAEHNAWLAKMGSNPHRN